MCTCKVCCYIQWTNESHNCHGGSPLRVRFFFFFPIMHLVKRLIRKRTAAVPPNHKIKNKYKLQFLVWNLKQLKNNLFWWKCIRDKTEPIPTTNSLWSILRHDRIYNAVSSQIPEEEHRVENTRQNSSLSDNASESFLFLLSLVLGHDFPDSPQNTAKQNNEYQHFSINCINCNLLS